MLNGTLAANLGGLPTIKAFTAEQRELDRVSTASLEYRAANTRAIRSSAAFVPLIRMAILAGFTTTLLVGGYAALDGSLPVGLYSVLVFMTQRLLWPLTRVGETLDLYQRGMASARRVLALLDEVATVVPGTRSLPGPARGGVELRGVHAGYADGPDVLGGIDLRRAARRGARRRRRDRGGQVDPAAARAALPGRPRRARCCSTAPTCASWSWESLRGAIGYVSQDVFLFRGSVARQHRLRPPGRHRRPGRGRGHRGRGATSSSAASPQGYDTLVGERGVTLSGGQRQRLALARAILRDPALLVLDEATSAVDNETEAAIQRSLARVTAGRSALMVAHRLSTVRDADRIWVLDAGRVVESGSHDELVAAGGAYAAMWAIQTGAGQAVAAPAAG